MNKWRLRWLVLHPIYNLSATRRRRWQREHYRHVSAEALNRWLRLCGEEPEPVLQSGDTMTVIKPNGDPLNVWID